MRALCLAAALLSGCSLVTPFDVRGGTDGAPVDGDGDSDLDGDADEVQDADGDSDLDGDADGDADVPPWDYLAGCVGGHTEEKWAVAALVDGLLRAYLTDRDCDNPVELCDGCFPTAFAPSGDALLVAFPATTTWRLDDEIALVHLGAEEHRVEHLSRHGAHPAWVDDDSFYYFAAPAGALGACAPGQLMERNALRFHELSTSEDVLVDMEVYRAWRGGAIAPAPDGSMLAVGWDTESECSMTNLTVWHFDVGSGDREALWWTEVDSLYFLLGLLPDGSGYLVQKSDAWGGDGVLSRLYVSSFDGLVESVRSGMDTLHEGSLLSGARAGGLWPGCATARRLGPSCEVYCKSRDGSRIDRYTLYGGDPEPVDCSELGEDVRIMDVWQQ